MKKTIIGLNLILLSSTCFAQLSKVNSNFTLNSKPQYSNLLLTNSLGNENSTTVIKTDFNISGFDTDYTLAVSMPIGNKNGVNSSDNVMISMNDYSLSLIQDEVNKNIFPKSDDFFEKNRRIIYSSLWTFASLNYLYCDLVSVMDKNMLLQYQTGNVDGIKITPQFLTYAGLFMQIPLSNVFLPQIIKNDRVLQWVQITSGTVMTLVQGASLFTGKPAPYYILFSTFEISTTAFITYDALKWKRNSKKRLIHDGF